MSNPSRSPARSPVTPSLYAPDLAAAISFYVDVFGFRKSGAYSDDDGVEIWAEVALGEGRIWFFSHALDDAPKAGFSGLIYVFVDDVDEMADRVGHRAVVSWGPETQAYGLRELGVRDLNGYLIVFAADV